ncbi:MAG TPA: guanylate kinase [Brumimicrobium sp.]|nr:guanylate kinase [Brumimicrobium sp.]
MNNFQNKGKCIIFSAPSGAGKTSIVHALINRIDELAFSISACSREQREGEKNGEDYYFIGVEGFKAKIKEDAFIEWEEVYKDHFYGTLKAEVERLWSEGKVVVFDVDVYGGINLKKFFGDAALSYFVLPPSIEVLEERLRKRQTETEDRILLRLSKANEELSKAVMFDKQVLNQDFETAVKEVEVNVKEFIQG